MVPSYPEALEYIWSQFGENQTFDISSCMVQRIGVKPFFVTNCPIPYYQNALMNTAREATAPAGTLQDHSKLDNPKWVYQGRSYGVGSSIGLMSPSDIPADLQLSNYSFEEIGYNAGVQCNHIKSTNLTIEYQINQESLGVFLLEGTLPNMAKPVYDPVIAWCDESPHKAVCEDPEAATLFAWLATSNDQGKSMVGIKATS